MLDLLRNPVGRSGRRLRPGLQRLLVGLVIPAVAIVLSIAVRSQTAAPSIPPVSLSSDPLFSTTSGDKPALALALSVEFPTAGAQYLKGPNDATDDSYSNTNEYLGYYDAESCYAYNDKPTETPRAGESLSDYKRFDRTGAATQRMCEDAFSGNFLNWASSSAVDMLRLALSGGDRSIDREDLTILQRAYISNGDPFCAWNTSTFPAKQLLRNGGNAGAYWGAVPIAMRTAAGSNDIWIASALNQIYFGTARSGACGSTDTLAYTLGAPANLYLPALGPVQIRSQALPSDASVCAGEGDICLVAGIREVWYGADTRWAVAPATGTIGCGGIGGDPAPGVYKHCYTRSYSGTWSPPASPPTTGPPALNTDGFFYSRVKVCDQDSDGALVDERGYPFCTRYPNGKYKPTGTIQKYSDSLRLAAFGYALDQTPTCCNGRYGGVLRAPMKYVGSKTFDEYGQENTPAGGNPASEWDMTTGIFKPNPDGDTSQTPAISGVVNYLNKFGRTGKPGRYKIYDPISELHYEALRYLQGLPPSPDAISNLTPQMYDGFPIYTDWSAHDPYANRPANGNYACLKSNIVMLGDINSNDSYRYSRFPAFNAAGNVPNFTAWFNTVAAFENGTALSYIDGQGQPRTTSNPNAPNPTALDRNKFALVGPAYWANTHDIRGTGWTEAPNKQRPGLRVKTFAFDVNQYGTGNDAANRRNRNQLFTAAKYGGFESNFSSKAVDKPYNNWGNPFVNEDGVANNDVWQDPTRPGEPNSFFLQSDARGILRAFDSIFAIASTQARSIAGAATRSSSLTEGVDNAIFQAEFDTTNWSGDLLALPLSLDAANAVSISETPSWRADDQLNKRVNAVADRNIVVGRPGATTVPAASSFTWDDIGTDLQQALNKPGPSSVADGLGKDRLAFIRGDHSKEGTVFRNRQGKRLGDIINSGVTYSGKPSSTINSTTYAGFASTNASRTPAVFVGANDGMLHAFDADTGGELFGYIPSWLGPKLSSLTSKTYLSNHQSFVDATPVVAEAQVGSANASTDWKTVLVGGTGAGGRGVYALDVTDPSTFSAANVMWEFTPADDIDPNDSNYSLGNVVGRPEILKFRTSAPDASPTFKWFAVVASGVNNYVPDSEGRFSETGKPAVYLLDLAKQPGAAWSLGTNYYKISFPTDSALSATKPTGVVNFKAALGAQQEVTKLFVGDLHGKLWKLDFRPHGSSNWNIGKLSAFNAGSDTSPQPYPLYVAKDASGGVQPISAAPMLVRGEGKESIYVAFGTGKYLEAADRASTGGNSFYVIHDDGTKDPDGGTSPVTSAITDRGRLKAGTFNSTTGALDVLPFVWGRATSDTDSTQRSGWYFDFPDTGERQVSGISLAQDTLIFSSLKPDASATTSTCGAGGGTGREYLINVDTGDGNSTASTVGLLGESIAMTIESATTSTTTDSTGRRRRVIKTQTLTQGSLGVKAQSAVTSEQIAGRLSWRQVYNYQDLKAAP
ncbi:pilus assembly protein [Variovorax sp. PBL-H6]|uniref:pilus assembly protein n=1 Tax=Variovorax sp. PBL-H6 TaxID=434009 RepID=UPI0013A54369|nr:PilC/PilY family type IV pilus protein [Variovorax sp. PBL-H6]